MKKPGRNDECWCGSGKKYKKCHLEFDERLEELYEQGFEVPDRDLIKTPEDIEQEVGEGVLITSLMGMHSGANPISGDFSLGAKGIMIQNGKKAFPIEQITIAGNFFDILKNIRAVGSDLLFAHPGMSCVGAPALYVGEISVAGK